MRYPSPLVLVIASSLGLAASFAGCGGSSAPVPSAPHSGAMFPLPNNKGFFEIRTESGVKPGRGGRSRSAKVEKTPFFVFFYQADGSTEMTPPPTDVTVKIGSAEKNTPVSLTPQAKNTEGAIPFAAPAANYPDAFRGELSANISGETVVAPFSFR